VPVQSYPLFVPPRCAERDKDNDPTKYLWLYSVIILVAVYFCFVCSSFVLHMHSNIVFISHNQTVPGVWNKTGQYCTHFNISRCLLLVYRRTEQEGRGFFKIYIRGSVHLNSKLKKSNEMQQYADIYLLLNYSTCLERPPRPSSGVHKAVVAASDTDHTICGTSFLKRDQIRTGVEPSGSTPVPS